MFGYTADEAIGQSVRLIIPADRQDEEDRVLEQIRSGGRIAHFETVRQRKDGALIPISLSVSPIRDNEGRVVGAAKIARNISERSRLLAIAQEQAFIAEKIGEVGATIAASLDRSTIVRQVTELATALTRAEFGAFFCNADDPPSGESFTLSALAGPRKEEIKKSVESRAGAVFVPVFQGEGVLRVDDVAQDSRCGLSPPFNWMLADNVPVKSCLAVPVKASSGEILGGLFLGHSRTAAFTHQHEQLATGIATWASLAMQNAHSYVVAREADRLKDEFLAVLSHELRTPLNAILGYARLLRAGILSGEKADRALDTLERNASSLTEIVEDVLDVSRIVSGKIGLDIQPVEVPLIVHNAVATVQPAADAKNVRVQIAVDSRVGPVAGDPDRLQQVIWNLLSNAVKFTPKDGRVQVCIQSVDSHVEVTVTDTGIGIPATFLPHVFERFRQADAGTTRKKGGLGLGLSIVRHIVEMHGGTVQAFSKGEGRGSTFRVQIPLMLVHPEGLTEPRPHARAARPARLSGLGSLDRVRVLAIDDEADALALLRVVLETAGAQVTTQSSAQAALEEVEALKPDVVVVDLGMPDVDGFEFIARLRSFPNPEVRDIPAAALTAFARSEDRTKALESGFEIHLAKPVDPGELVATVATLVRRSRRSTPDGIITGP
jgi:signal transduction histidine kinase/CheY-like chemotaxis protein